MRARILVAASLGLALLVGLYFMTRGAGRHVESPSEKSATVAEAATPVEEPEFVPVLEPPAREPVAAADTSTPEVAARFVVLGRVVDEDDRPLAGVTVRLLAVRVWAEGHEIPRLSGPYPYHGWEVLTSADGGFRVEGPPPTAERQMLTLTPDDFHDSERVFFGQGEPRQQPGIRAGETDLGTFRLATTGVIRGFVFDEDGHPIEGAELDVGSEPSLTIGRGGLSDGNGAFVVAHVKPGTHGIEAEAEGYLSVFLKPVEVEAGRVTDGIEFVLQRAPTIAGRVIDEAGAPLADVRLWGWPQSSGSGAGARTALDGSFTLHLPQHEPYTLEAELDGYASYGVDDHTTHYPPGTDDIEIVLGRGHMTLFRVVDAETGEPLERFGLRVIQGSGVSHGSPPRLRDHPGGEVELGARPEDFLEVVADGFKEVDGFVQHDAPDTNVMTIRLTRGVTVTGRVVDAAGHPQENALVQLTAGRTTSMISSQGDRARDGFRVRHGARTLSATTDASGRFGIVGASPGEFLLEARGDAGAPARREGLRVGLREKTKDVGDLVLLPGAAILGNVLVPPGIAAGGLKIYLDDWHNHITCTTDSEGCFRFENLTAGEHTLTIEDVPGRLADLEHTVELGAGETRDVTLDAREQGLCEVTLAIQLGDEAVAGIRVQALPVHGLLDRQERLLIGETDAAGRVTGFVRAAGEAEIEIFTPAWTTLRHPTARVALVHGVPVERSVRFPVGTVTVRIPGDVVLPTKGLVSILFGPDGGAGDFSASVQMRTGATPTPGARIEEDGRTFVFDHVPPGTHGLRFQIRDDDDERKITFEAQRSVTVREGEGVTLDLR